MTVSATTRKAGPYLGNGSTKEFSFPFKVFQASDVFVARTSANGEVELTLNTDYTVRLNSNQDTTAGGVVVLTNPLEDGQYLSVISQIDYDQLAIFTNKGGFYPETLNDCYDKLTILCQQLLEELSRCVKLDITDTMSGTELKQRLLDAATTATELAKQYAESAQASATLAADYASKTGNVVNQVLEEGNNQVARVDAEGESQAVRLADLVDSATGVAKDKVIATGNTQVNRVIQAGETVLTRNQLKCLYGAINYATDQASGATVTLPASVSYVVGLNHLRVSVNGLVLYKGIQYEEVGTEMYESTQIKLLMALKATDTLEAWVIPTGGTFNESTGEVVPDEGAECQYGVWTATTAVTAESSLVLPITYVAGKNHLCMSVNGLLLTPTTNFAEVGTTGDKSTSIVIKFDLKVGDEVCAWTVPYDRGTASETETQIKALQDALADLSQKVVYKDESSAS